MTACFSHNGRDFGSVEQLWKEIDVLPNETFEMHLLRQNLYQSHWNGRVCAYDVIEHPFVHWTHTWRCIKADLSYPIVVMYKRNEGWVVLDGMHRLLKADWLGYETIQAVVVNQTLVDRCWLFSD
ncbi:MAG: hypothetical protein CMP20_10460 [Rickettsiales bacterium]|nr:hypothetical protein [Rickettsiales bacterium]